MSAITKTFVQSLSVHELNELIQDWDSFERKGQIGDSLLRTKTDELAKECGFTEYYAFHMWAMTLMLEVMRETIRRLEK